MGDGPERWYGMGQIDDGAFCHKLHRRLLQLHLKMGAFKRRAPWAEIWDGPLLALALTHHRTFFSCNPPLALMVSLLDQEKQWIQSAELA